jgi:hypothetical protein
METIELLSQDQISTGFGKILIVGFILKYIMQKKVSFNQTVKS